MAPARLDLIGLGLLGILAAWVLLSAELEGGDPRDYLGTLGLLACGYLAGRLSARWAWIVATVVAWARYAELFRYSSTRRVFYGLQPPTATTHGRTAG